MPEPDVPLYDAAALDQLTADTDAQFRAIALGQFRLDLADFIERLEAQNAQGRLRLIHTMGSSAALMGAMRLSAFCHELETGASRMGEGQIRQVLALARATACFFADLDSENPLFRKGKTILTEMQSTIDFVD